MSHKQDLNVVVDNEEALIEALKEMGYDIRHEKHTLRAYQWTMDCDLSVTKNGNQLYIGFKKQDDGTFKMETDLYGTDINAKKLQEQINQLHGKYKAASWLAHNRYNVSLETDNEGNMVVIGTKWN